MYLRFILAGEYLPGRQRAGLIRVYRSFLSRAGREEAQAILNLTFLPVPGKVAFSGDRGLCWFKLRATGFIEQLRALAFLIEREGGRVWQVYSRNPGLITYEDEYQVVAVPYAVLSAMNSL